MDNVFVEIQILLVVSVCSVALGITDSHTVDVSMLCSLLLMWYAIAWGGIIWYGVWNGVLWYGVIGFNDMMYR